MKARMTMYRVGRCGYYRRGSDDPAFGDFESTVVGLKSWLSNRTMGDSAPAEAMAERERVFFADLSAAKPRDSVVLVTWNETKHLEGIIQFASATATVGEPDISDVQIGKNKIPGHPSYFWLLPKQRLLATIQFGGRFNGHVGLQGAITAYLARHSKHCVWDDEAKPGQERLLGYAESSQQQPESFLPRFDSSPVHQAADFDYLRKNRGLITRTHRRVTVDNSKPASLTLGRSLLQAAGFADKDDFAQEHLQVEYHIRRTLSDAELEHILMTHQAGNHEDWDDTGFYFKTPIGKVIWLSDSLDKTEVTLEGLDESADFMPADAIHTALRKSRAEILSRYQIDDNADELAS